MTSQALPGIRTRLGARTTVVRGPRVVPLLFFTMLVIALFFAMIYLRIALDRNAFELEQLESQIELEQSRQLDLRLEIARLQDPLRVSSEAQRIGLTHPDERIAISITGEREVAPPVVEDPVSALSSKP